MTTEETKTTPESEETKGAGADQTAPDDFDAAWDEYAGGFDGKAPSDKDRAEPAPADDDPDPAPSDADDGGDDGSQDQGRAEDATGGDTPSQNTDGSGPQDATQGQGNDPFASLPSEARAEVDRMRQENRRHRGNQAALQRELDRIRRQYPDTSKQASGKTDGGQGRKGTDDQPPADGQDPLDSDDWKKLRDEYPEVTGPLERQFQAMRSQLDELKQGMTGVTGHVQEQTLQRNYETVAAQHEDFARFTTAPEGDPWAQTYAEALESWAAEQLPEVQQVIERNADDVVEPEKVDRILTQFKQSSIYQRYLGQSDGQKAADKTEPSADQAGKSDDTSSRRRRRMDSAPSVGGKGPGAATGAPDDYDNAFDHFAKQIEGARR